MFIFFWFCIPYNYVDQMATFETTLHIFCHKFCKTMYFYCLTPWRWTAVRSFWYRKYPHFPLLSYLSVVVCLRCLLHHILLLVAYIFRENREFVFIIIVQFMMSANNRIRFVLTIVFVCLYIIPSHYYHCANLSEDIELIKCLSDIFCPVCE